MNDLTMMGLLMIFYCFAFTLNIVMSYHVTCNYHDSDKMMVKFGIKV